MKITLDPEDAGTTISISQLPAEPGDSPEEEAAEITTSPAPKPVPSPPMAPAVSPSLPAGADVPSENLGTVKPLPKVANLLDRQGGENVIFDPRKGDPHCFQFEPPEENL